MPFAQFNEVRIAAGTAVFDSTYVPPANLSAIGASNYAQRADLIIASNSDVADALLTVLIGIGGGQLIGNVRIPTGAGNGTIPIVDVLATLITDQSQRFLLQDSQQSLIFRLAAAPTAPGVISVYQQGGSF